LIEVSDLHKSYGSTVAVDGVTLGVRAGEVFGLLGPNGAGKSTTIGMMVGSIPPDSGTVEMGGAGDPRSPRVRSKIGLAPQSLAIYDEMSASENLSFFASLYAISGSLLKTRIDWALDLSGLTDRKGDLVSTFSGGMKRRLNLACALVHDPRIVFLDEPTVGVDPQSRNYIFDTVERLKTEGLTVVYTTHYMEEAQRLCDRVGIMDKGKMLALDTVDALVSSYGGASVVTAEFERPPKDLVFAGAEIDDTTMRITSQEPFREIAKLADTRWPLKTLKVDRPDLESVFLSLTGRRLRD
jgi:ABC-2 type transport system ATP-binding protein